MSTTDERAAEARRRLKSTVTSLERRVTFIETVLERLSGRLIVSEEARDGSKES